MIEQLSPSISTLKEQLINALPGSLFFLENPLDRALEVNADTVKTLQELGYRGVYVTLTKDFLTLSDTLEKKAVDVASLSFVDGISHMYGIGEARAANVAYVPGPLSLDEIIAAVKSALAPLGDGKHFIIVDSSTIVLLYNAFDQTLSFAKTLYALLKDQHAIGIFVFVSSSTANREMINALKQLDSASTTAS